MNAEKLENRIHKVEGFIVVIEYNGDDLKGYPKKLCKDDDSVTAWRKQFYERYPSALVTVLKGNGDIAHGNMCLFNLIRTYEIRLIMSEIFDLKDKVKELESKQNGDVTKEDLVKKACVTLSISPDELTPESVKLAYRHKVKIFAPDTIQHLVDEGKLHNEFLTYATRKTSEINVAYSQLKQECEQKQEKD